HRWEENEHEDRERLQRIHGGHERGRRDPALHRSEEQSPDDLHRTHEAGDGRGGAQVEASTSEIRDEMYGNAIAQREAEEPEREPAEGRMAHGLAEGEARPVM